MYTLCRLAIWLLGATARLCGDQCWVFRAITA